MAIPYTLVEADEDHLKATTSSMLFMVWRRRTLADAFRRAVTIVERLATKNPAGIGVCQVIEVDAIPPDSAARSVFVEFHRMGQVKHCTVIHDGAGFKAASVRAVMVGTITLARPPGKVTVHSSVQEAATWHTEQDRRLAAADIATVVGELRTLHRERYP
jgi:hypothetical protein